MQATLAAILPLRELLSAVVVLVEVPQQVEQTQFLVVQVEAVIVLVRELQEQVGAVRLDHTIIVLVQVVTVAQIQVMLVLAGLQTLAVVEEAVAVLLLVAEKVEQVDSLAVVEAEVTPFPIQVEVVQD
jgi:hypothetical protein